MTWRPMGADDLAAVSAIAAEVHPAYPEDDAVLAERPRLWPGGCIVHAPGGAPDGYALSFPWRGAPPALNALIGALPAEPAAYYVHDLALRPGARGGGAGRAAVALIEAQARALGLPIVLVAIPGAEGFWRRHGFAAAGPAAGFGPGATLMRRDP